MSSNEQCTSVECGIGATSSSKFPPISTKLSDVFHIDIVPSRFLINSEIDTYVRKLCLHIVDFIRNKHPATQVIVTYPKNFTEAGIFKHSVQTSKNLQVWKIYPRFNIHENYTLKSGQISAFAESWESIHAISDHFRACRSYIASISSLTVGLYPSDDQTFTRDRSCTKLSSYSYDFRLAIPTWQPFVGYLLATPPSLPWSLAVALEFFRLQAIDGEKRSCESSNLTTNTVGVLRNWIDFILYGSLIDSDNEVTNYLREDWIRSTSRSSVLPNSSFPATMTIVFDCTGLISDTFSTKNLDEQLVQIDRAWQSAVFTMRAGGALLVSLEELENTSELESMFGGFDILCQRRFAEANAHCENLEKMETEVLIT